MTTIKNFSLSLKGIRNSDTLMIVSSGSSVTLEDIAYAEPKLIKWFQLFIYKDRSITLDLAKRAEKCGYKAIVITVDFPVIGMRYHNIRNNYVDNIERANYRKYGVEKDVAQDANWNDIKLLKSQIKIPLVLKGILTAEDARLAVEYGADGVLVSNHGGRQLDESPATVSLVLNYSVE
jgi:(S)-2-hydroxy-acid oxidase